MKNVTISMEDELYVQVKRSAHEAGKSLNSYLRELLAQRHNTSIRDRLAAHWRYVDTLNLQSNSGFLTRDEAHVRGEPIR